MVAARCGDGPIITIAIVFSVRTIITSGLNRLDLGGARLAELLNALCLCGVTNAAAA